MLQKVLLTLALIFLVWFGFKYVSRLAAMKAAKPPAPKPGAKAAEIVQDMEKCPTCGSFVAAGARSCGRSDCPYPGR